MLLEGKGLPLADTGGVDSVHTTLSHSIMQNLKFEQGSAVILKFTKFFSLIHIQYIHSIPF